MTIPRDKSEHKGVWVFLEARRGRLRDVSRQLLGVARQLAAVRGSGVSGVLP
jgi:hypothetical protein